MEAKTVRDENTEALLRRITRRIVEAVDPERVILFGSRAKGTAAEHSDFDLCVIADMDGSRRERNLRLRKLFPMRSFSMDVFVFTRGEFEQRKKTH